MDLKGSRILWDIPFGTIADIAPAPVPNFEWGVPNMGGPLMTESGLVFIGAAAEYVFRAFDVTTGKELWQADLPTSANATPVSYELDGLLRGHRRGWPRRFSGRAGRCADGLRPSSVKKDQTRLSSRAQPPREYPS